MKYLPKVTVITVVFNGHISIESTITNVLGQDYPNLEYIIVDGNSTDGTLEIIKKFDSKISKVISEPDNGLYDAMNKAAAIATGEWLIYRNSGDYFFSTNTISLVFQNYIDKGEDLIAGNTRIFNNFAYKDCKINYTTKSYWEDMPFWHSSTFIRRTLQLKNPYDIKYRNSADYKFFLHCLIDGSKYCIFDNLIAVFNVSDGTTVDNFDRTIKDNINILIEFKAGKQYIDRQMEILKHHGRISFFRKWIFILFPFVRNYLFKRDGWILSPCKYSNINN